MLKNLAIALEQQKLAEENLAIAQKNAEQAEYQAHLDELKLKTALGMLETTGQLEERAEADSQGQAYSDASRSRCRHHEAA